MIDIKQCYLGNTKLKKAGVAVSMNIFEAEEYFKCMNDVIYFVKNYVKIISLDDGLVPFLLYPFQERMLESMRDNRFTIFLTPRQMGKTTVVAAFLLHQITFEKDFTIAILANKGDQAREIMGRIQLMYEEMPWWMQPGVKVWNKGSISLGNKSRAFTASTTSSSVRGKSLNCVYLDEFAHVENDVDFYQSTYPVITSGTKTKVIITSTSNGMNLYYKLFSDAVTSKNDYVPLKIKWQEHPKRDQAWYEEQCRNMSPRQVAQEINCEFHGSSDTLISGDTLQSLVVNDPIKIDNHFKIYEFADKKKNYIVTADCSEGVGKDYSVCSVFDVTAQPYKHIAIYRDNMISPMLFAKVVFQIAMMFNEATLLVESNSIGTLVCNILWNDLEYENMLTTKLKDGDNVVSGSGRSIPGVRMTKRTKSLGCSQLKTFLESRSLILHDFDVINEFSTFVAKDNSYSAQKGKFDDCVMTFVLFAWFATESYFAEMVDSDVKGILRKRLEEMSENELLSLYYDDGTEDEEDLSLLRVVPPAASRALLFG